MVIASALPKQFLPCGECGATPDPAGKLAYLAGCPDDHTVHLQDSIYRFETMIAHVWADGTYSALRVPDTVTDEPILLAWLDAVHAGKTTRRQREIHSEVVFDDITILHHVIADTGEVMPTYSFPPVEGG